MKESISRPYRRGGIPALSAFFAICLLLGTSYQLEGNWFLIFGSLPRFFLAAAAFTALFLLFRTLLDRLFRRLDTCSPAPVREGKARLVRLFDEKPFLVTLGALLLFWSPMIVAYYPVVLSPDPAHQILQYFGFPTDISNSVILLDPAVQITNHHPLLHTLLLGTSLKIGVLIGNQNLGLFLYSIVQIALLSTALAASVAYLKHLGLSRRFRFFTLLVYGLVPVFPFFAMAGVKDVIFSSLLIFYTILLHHLSRREGKLPLRLLAAAAALMVLAALFRNNGIEIVLLSFPFLFFLRKEGRLAIGATVLAVLVLYLSYSKILLPALKVTPGSIREVLSIPFQQTARFVREYPDDLTEEEKGIIDKVLDYDTLAARYNPELSDAVKNEYNQYATEADLKAYFGVWFQGLFRHPDSYVQATFHNIYGYFDPFKLNWYLYHNFNSTIVEEGGFDYHFNGLAGLRNMLWTYGKVFQWIPPFALFVNIGFHVWVLLAMAVYLHRRRLFLRGVFLFPGLALILVCIASPANTYFRYALPYVMGMPLVLGLFLHLVGEQNTTRD